MVELRSRMPYADLDDSERDRRLIAVADLFTVGLLGRYVEWKLSRDNRAVSVDRTDAPVMRDSPAVHQPLSPGR
jgi:hypothetical protein